MTRVLLSAGMLLLTLITTPASAREITIPGGDLNPYFDQARPGDIFLLEDGTFNVTRTTNLAASGTKDAPITIRPAYPGSRVKITVDSLIGFHVSGAYWVVEGLDIMGTCAKDNECEHAFQIVGKADGTVIRNNRLIDFNAAIKGNGIIEGSRQYFPDHVLIEGNQIYNRHPRDTGNPVTPIDVVGGRFWTVRDNFLADFQKAGGDGVSYAAFLKGNSDNGLFERNLVICEWQHQGGVRLGLSLGGGGTSDPNYCQGRSCTIQHYNGTIRSNVIMNCPNDVGIYLNSAASTTVTNNTILNTLGVDVRFNGSFAILANNVIEGRIKARDDGRFREDGNLVRESMDRILPDAGSYDFTPDDPDDLEDAARGYTGVDFCTGQPQENWVGAFAVPVVCSIQDKLAKIIARRP